VFPFSLYDSICSTQRAGQDLILYPGEKWTETLDGTKKTKMLCKDIETQKFLKILEPHVDPHKVWAIWALDQSLITVSMRLKQLNYKAAKTGDSHHK